MYTANKVYNDFGSITRFTVASNLFWDYKTALVTYIQYLPVRTSIVELIMENTSYQRIVMLVNKTNNNYFSFIGTSFYIHGSFSARYNNGTWNDD
jgi:hypothetical protein